MTANPESRPGLRRQVGWHSSIRCAGVAFLSVFAQHVFIDEIARLARSQDTAVASVFGAVYRFVRIEGAPGVFGVVLFFVISGYCIAKAARRETPAQFAVRRAFRIYPLLVVALALEVLLMRVEGGALPAARALLGSVTLTGDFLNVPPRLAGVEWTLRLELLFYATIGLGLVLVTRRPMLPIVVPTVWRYAAILAVIALLPPFPAAMWTRGYVNLFAPFFVIGAAFAAYERGQLARASLVLVVLASFGVSLWTQYAIRPNYGRFAGYYLAAVALFTAGWWLRNRMGGSRIVYLLSLLTYATYLFHAFLVRAFERGFERFFPGGGELVLGAISPNKLGAIALFFVVMGALVALVEQPLIRWAKRLA